MFILPGTIIFIGAGGFGLTAAFSLARKDPDLKIILFSPEPVVAYSQCGMPFVLDGKIKGFDELIIYTPDVFKSLGLDVRTGTKVTSIDIDARCVVTDKNDTFNYDRLVIATGSVPFTPPISGTGLNGVHRLVTLEDGRSLAKDIAKAKNAVIIGGGPIGMETAPAFLDMGIKLTIVERMPQLFPGSLDPDMASIVEEYLSAKGARIITGKGVDSINGSGSVVSVTVDGELIPADLVLISSGVRPNVELAKRIGLDIGVTGGIKTDEYFRVTKNGKIVEGVFAGGDCIEVMDAITKKPALFAVGSVANRQAGFLADQLLGKNIPYHDVLCPSVCVVGELHIGSVGLTTRSSTVAGIVPVSFKAKGNTRARYYPGGKKIDIKLISDGDRIVGGQVIGEEGVQGRINVLSLAIRKNTTPEELARTETCYAPPVSPMIDPLTYTAEMLALKCTRQKRKNKT